MDRSTRRVGRDWSPQAIFGLRAAMVLSFVLAITPATASAQQVSCTISSNAVTFGSYQPLFANATSPLDGTGTITYRCACTGGWGWLCFFFPVQVQLTIDLSSGQSLSYTSRQMGLLGSTTEKLLYNLYVDAARQQIWGDGTGATRRYSATINVSGPVTANVSVFGRVPAWQDVAPGSYSDQILVTANY